MTTLAAFFLLALLGILGHCPIDGYTPLQSTRTTTTAPTPSLSLALQSSSRRDLLLGSAAVAAAAFTSFPTSASANGEVGFTEDPRGFSYKVITPGSSSSIGPTARGQKVTVSYTLSLNGFVIDGQTSNPVGQTVESSSGLLGDKPIVFPIGVGSVIKGWDYAVKSMKVGERRLVIIPPELGYGKATMKGAAIGGVDIPAYSTLYFDITLKDVGPEPVLNEKQRKWLEENPE